MSEQVHAPPNDEEARSIRHGHRDSQESASERFARIKTWREGRGWCSSCRQDDVVVAHMGTDERNFALCEECIVRLARCIESSI